LIKRCAISFNNPNGFRKISQLFQRKYLPRYIPKELRNKHPLIITLVFKSLNFDWRNSSTLYNDVYAIISPFNAAEKTKIVSYHNGIGYLLLLNAPSQ
jgi:hypothetical protein